MNDFVILTDSCCDLPADLAREWELEVLPLSVHLGEQEFLNDLDGRSISFHEFYEQLRQEALCTTAAVNMGTFQQKMEALLKQGKDVLCILFSSGLSNTYNAGQLAAKELVEKYPERKLYTVDSLCASLGQGLLIAHAVKLRKSGKSIDQVRDWIEENKLKLCHWFTVDDLNHLKRGGRVSSATALIGTVLGIKPVLHVDDEGHLINVGKARGRKASLSALVDQMEETIIDPEKQMIYISHGDCLEDAEWVRDEILRRFHVKEILINYVGPVIGAHSGPGTVALFFLGIHR
ncbi:MAG: DegV family protein [Clostridium sp.]|uniref:DegV family protein n=1 Tax=Clostridium sp. TaxID=1506 RepID=UPI00290AE16A|nr:DegV family protein [Clostridium sp.]MDU7336962.1 DegV family protein [Clostridium sp.]